MEKQLKTFEVIQIIPSTTFVTYRVQAIDAEEAEFMVDNEDELVEKIRERSQDSTWEGIEYDVNEIDSDDF
jgi:hypothetical protein